jgi:nuclear transport factor 2 (NTF2) superfamily protein
MKPDETDETGWNRMKPDETGWNGWNRMKQMKPDETDETGWNRRKKILRSTSKSEQSCGSERSQFLKSRQGCQIFLGTKYQNGKMYQITVSYTKCPWSITKDRKMDKVSIKYTIIFHCKTLQNLPKFGFLVWKQTIWQPCPVPSKIRKCT